jgi:hypothetical protein
VRVYGFAHDVFVTHCANGDLNTTIRGCVEDDLTPGNCPSDCVNIAARPLYVIIDTDHITQNVVDHELGHVLYFGEHYIKNPDGTYSCGYPSGTTVMDAIGCGATSPQAHDRNDFFNVYKPQDTPNATTMTPGSSTQVTYAWNSGAAYRHNIESFYVDKTSDTNTTVLQFNNVSVLFSSQSYSIADEGRFCATARGFSNAGFTGGNPWTPYPYYGCANRRTGPNAGGPFVATSQREYGSRIKVRNDAGATRYIKVVGPSGENVGCSTAISTANGATYQCVASVTIRQFANLVWIACTTSGCTAASYGNIDFDIGGVR